MALVGTRQLPLEDVPDDAFERTLPRETRPRPGQIALVRAVMQLYTPGATPVRFKRCKPVGEGVFGGRWLEEPRGIVVYAHADPMIERAVTIHETCHVLRCLLGGDGPGEHDQAFLALAEDAYRVWRVPCSVAKLVEGQYPASWDW